MPEQLMMNEIIIRHDQRRIRNDLVSYYNMQMRFLWISLAKAVTRDCPSYTPSSAAVPTSAAGKPLEAKPKKVKFTQLIRPHNAQSVERKPENNQLVDKRKSTNRSSYPSHPPSASPNCTPSSSHQFSQNEHGRKKQLVRLYGVCY